VFEESFELQGKVAELLDEVSRWYSPAESAPLRARTQSGNLSYRYALRILLLRQVFGVGADDIRVVEAANAILELGHEVLATHDRVTW